MKVLKKGNGTKGWSRRLKCTGSGNGDGGCGALLLVEHADLFMTCRHFIDGSGEQYTTFCCPECKVLTDINDYTGPEVTLNHQSWKRKQYLAANP